MAKLDLTQLKRQVLDTKEFVIETAAGTMNLRVRKLSKLDGLNVPSFADDLYEELQALPIVHNDEVVPASRLTCQIVTALTIAQKPLNSDDRYSQREFLILFLDEEFAHAAYDVYRYIDTPPEAKKKEEAAT